jgi:uroporphyrinogen decarboxylase
MNDLFLRACRREPVERTPVWLMRQAGRYLPEYRAVRERVDFLTLCRTPDLVVEVTLQPIDRFGLDAAILFSDILTPLEPMGLELDFTPGPVLANPVREAADVERLRVPDPEEDLAFVSEAVRLLRRELEGRVPLIGFGGAPFTLATYVVEGGGAKEFTRFREMALREPGLADRLLEKITETVLRALRAQVEAGAQAIQLFDTWAGLLAPRDYAAIARPWARRVFDGLADLDVPRIYFARGGAALADEMRDVGADVISVDWRLPLGAARERLGPDLALQGNLDPVVLLGAPELVEERAREVLRQAEGASGHVFNLGHGILPRTPIESVTRLVEVVRRETETRTP